MSKKSMIILVAVLTILLLGGGIYAFLSVQKPVQEKTDNELTVGTTEINVEETKPTMTVKGNMKVWDDPAGFLFQYNNDLKVNNHPDDKVNYANLELTGTEPGKLKIYVADTSYKTTMDWQKKQSGKGDTVKIAGKDGYLMTLNIGTRILGLVDAGALYTISIEDVPAGLLSTYWQERFNQVVSTFKLVYPTAAPAAAKSSGNSSGSVINEEEEVVE